MIFPFPELKPTSMGVMWVWRRVRGTAIFFLCVTPNILNGFHVSSYTLLGHLPEDQWCGLPDLDATNWTLAQRRHIAEGGLNSGGCTVWDWNYKHLGQMSYEAALNYTSHMSEINRPAEVSCKVKGSYEYADPESTFVSDWDLTCERSIQRTSAQVSISLGKFCGSFSFGILADKFGRKTSFTLGAVFFVVGSFFCTFSPWYSLFLAGRFALGAASSGLFYPAFTMIVENVCLKHRSWMSIAFSASYPIGMIILAIIGYLIQPWRHLQLALTIPSLLLVLNCYLMNESPRWLITNQRYDRVYKILFKQPSHYDIQPALAAPSDLVTDKKSLEPESGSSSLLEKLKNGPLKSIIELYANPNVRKLIFTSYFMFCVTSLSYYVTALNAANLSVSRYLYIVATGLVDIPSYLVPVIMLRFTGRRITTMFLFMWTGVSLLLVLSVPAGSTTWIVAFAMLGRFGISATYSVVTLYTAELYPTQIRNSALGTCSTFAHVGSISAPYVVDVLGALGWYIPTTICGCCVLVAGLLTLTLPETGTGKLSDKIDSVAAADAQAPVAQPEKPEKQ
ncbi:organic cation transporter protein isoform X2 [Drosophila pseudoobscura]|uniref:Organic cation transporter protein isoform X2 n=1 Tax=Drosophila pseudoobscura pseudoobscura TaxID=46245 RepID=A0A6I8VAX1_DROPS|nr:organic cation transporter protein isoform X2 [Drosophila pseudoobscura]